jgi:hypothetical protein
MEVQLASTSGACRTKFWYDAVPAKWACSSALLPAQKCNQVIATSWNRYLLVGLSWGLILNSHGHYNPQNAAGQDQLTDLPRRQSAA